MSKKQVLIIEDDEDIQEIYKEMILSSLDVELRQCYNGKEGVDAVRAIKPDLVILDLLMPVMNGEEFLKELRYTLDLKDVPVIVCSVNQTLAHKLLGQKEVEAVLPKLFLQKDLESVVSKYLTLKSKDTEGQV